MTGTALPECHESLFEGILLELPWFFILIFNSVIIWLDELAFKDSAVGTVQMHWHCPGICVNLLTLGNFKLSFNMLYF